MAESLNFLAVDLGAESGRVILGEFDGHKIRSSEVHRFSTGPTTLPDGLHWDVLRFWDAVKKGMAVAARERTSEAAGLGLDAWGVDFALLDRQGTLLSNPHHYRDGRTDGMLAHAFARVPKEEIFEQTGIQFIQINSVYQLLSMVMENSPVLDAANTFLTMPDLFNYWLTGQAVCEFSNATTTQCFDTLAGNWAIPMLDRLGIPSHIFPEVVQPGTVLGPLFPSVSNEVGLGRVPVIAPACHDTGSAVAAVPAEGPGFAWISSGTWSVMGAELPAPVISDLSLAYNFTNEGGVGGTFRFSRNITGLWLVQECRSAWAREGTDLSYDDLTQMAAQADPLQAIVDPDHSDFLRPGDMPDRIRTFCQRTDQPVPVRQGAVVRCALESIALKYRWVLDRLEEMLGYQLEPLHIVGGGTKNRLLSQMAANATGHRVVSGPAEATATGNVLMQAMALGHIASVAEGREVVRDSFDLEVFEPGDGNPWDEAYDRLLSLMGKTG
jgi:sugar (pentulose or hexulose) kinase